MFSVGCKFFMNAYIYFNSFRLCHPLSFFFCLFCTAAQGYSWNMEGGGGQKALNHVSRWGLHPTWPGPFGRVRCLCCRRLVGQKLGEDAYELLCSRVLKLTFAPCVFQARSLENSQGVLQNVYAVPPRQKPWRQSKGGEKCVAQRIDI